VDDLMPETVTRGHKKRARTRRQLLDAGLSVLADKGDAITVSDVVVAAGLANGTFYNYFDDRDALLDALAAESMRDLADRAAADTAGADPALRFAVASLRVLRRAATDPQWGRVLVRLSDPPRSSRRALASHLRADLADGHAQGRFRWGDDEATLDLVVGTIMAAVRRLSWGRPRDEHPVAVVTRLLVALGLDPADAAVIVGDAEPAP
jgi:AcrR family transcriptional regulator